MLNLQTFIRENENWRELISEKPYCIRVTEKDNLVCFKYSQIDSDFNEPLVRECRGVILEKNTWKVVAMAFEKFFNYGEVYADEIDWESAVVTSKEDGSLIKVFFYDNEWKVATNGMIDATDAELNSPLYKNFMELFDAAAENSKLDFDKLDTNCTYVMELCSSENHIIVPYNEPKLFHLTTRDNRTLEEVEVDIGIEKPKEWALSSLEDCISMAATFDFTKEGFVCRDKNYNRIKIKGEDYIKAHRLTSNNTINTEKAIELIRMNELDEFLVYCPQYKEYINDVHRRLEKFYNKIRYNVDLALIEKINCETRKDFAAIATKSEYPMLWFNVYNTDCFNIEEWIDNIKSTKLAALIEKI